MAASSAGSEGSTSASTAQAGSAAGRSSATPSACRCWRGTGQMSLGFETSENSRLEPIAVGSRSMRSSEVFPARTSATPGPEWDFAESEADSGPSSLESCPACDPAGFWLRTCLGSSCAAATGCFTTWRCEATPRGRAWWVLDMSELRTDATASGSWPTAASRDWKGGANWANRQRDGAPRRESDQTLADVVERMWPTPTAGDRKDAGGRNSPTNNCKPGTTLTDAVRGRGPQDQASSSTSGKRRARLNPRWVCQLMGFPVDWLDDLHFEPSEMRACLKSSR